MKLFTVMQSFGLLVSSLVKSLEIWISKKIVKVEPYLTPQHFLPNHDSVFVVGDCASLPYAPSAQLAEAQAEQIVEVLIKKWANEPLPESFPTNEIKRYSRFIRKKTRLWLSSKSSDNRKICSIN